MVVIMFDKDNDWDISLIDCGQYKIEDSVIGTKTLMFNGINSYINHNADFGLGSTFLYTSARQINVNLSIVITEYKSLDEGKRTFFNLIIKEGYGGDYRNYLNDFFTDYVYDNRKLETLEWILEYIK